MTAIEFVHQVLPYFSWHDFLDAQALPADNGVLNQLKTQIETPIQLGFTRLSTVAMRLLALVGAIQIAISALYWAMKGEDAIIGLLKNLVTLSLFALLIISWPQMTKAVLQGGEWVAYRSLGQAPPGVGGNSSPGVDNPSGIYEQYFVVTAPIVDTLAHAETSSFSGLPTNIGLVLILIFAMFVSWFAYAILAIQAVVTYAEFLIVSLLSIVLVPFGANPKTAFISEKAIGAIVAHGVKVMVLAFIVALGMPVLLGLANAGVINIDPNTGAQYRYISTNGALALALAPMLLAWLAWQVPAVAGGMMSGGPSLSAGSALGAVIGAAFVGAKAAAAGGSVAKGTASAAGQGANATIAAAGAVSSGASMGSAVASNEVTSRPEGSTPIQRMAATVGGAVTGIGLVASAGVSGAVSAPIAAVTRGMAKSLETGKSFARSAIGISSAPPGSSATSNTLSSTPRSSNTSNTSSASPGSSATSNTSTTPLGTSQTSTTTTSPPGSPTSTSSTSNSTVAASETSPERPTPPPSSTMGIAKASKLATAEEHPKGGAKANLKTDPDNSDNDPKDEQT